VKNSSRWFSSPTTFLKKERTEADKIEITRKIAVARKEEGGKRKGGSRILLSGKQEEKKRVF